MTNEYIYLELKIKTLELHTGGTLAREQARRWRGHVRKRERRQRGLYVQR